jgi:phospholipase C
MDSRREFLKKAMLLSGATGVSRLLPASIQKAFAIDPAPNSTYMDAEHIVLLMQENRSFDHTYGTLQGVRGFNDPRAMKLPDNNLVWLQTNEKGETYAPFHLDIKHTKITWMGSLPHSWTNQVDARNNGRYDKWLDEKKSGDDAYAEMPLTMGYYTREDIPFYYALADAFTVCDQNFCSSLTGTTPNRLYFWTGTIRAEQNENSRANVWNEDADYNTMVSWKTFPERLEENNIPWKIYQNDISVDGGFTEEEDAWLASFGDNPLEYFTQYNVKLSERYINYLQKKSASLPDEIAAIEERFHAVQAGDAGFKDLQKKLKEQKALLEKINAEKLVYTREKYNKLSQHEKNLHERAFTVNTKDPDYHALTTLKYKDGDTERAINIPKGDLLYQLREDVNNGTLPTVSWIVAPEAFSDHPASAWFGAWYLSEVMDILTKNPEVWKKTIFILNYDENDGYFDHVPPFVAPNPHDASTGKTSPVIDTSVDYVTMQQERNRVGTQAKYMRESPIGLGYRVPMVVASPWSRGGYVNSQVFDHTSSLQFLEKFLTKKTGKQIEEPNISKWRRTVCGDLTSVFKPYKGEKIDLPDTLEKDRFIESIHKAKFTNLPTGYKKLSKQEIEQINKDPQSLAYTAAQEKGIRPANALPYEIYADGILSADKKTFEILLKAGNNIFEKNAAGVPFTVYLANNYRQQGMTVSSYAVSPGDTIKDSWNIQDFKNNSYHIIIHGPNGFFREFIGDNNNPLINISCVYQRRTNDAKKLTGNLQIDLRNPGNKNTVEVIDHYRKTAQAKLLDASARASVILDLNKSHGWYDCTIKVKGNNSFVKRYAGRIETGKESFTDPAMGRVVI